MCFGGGGASQKAQKEAQQRQDSVYAQQQQQAAAAEAQARAEAARRASNLNTGMANINNAFAGYNDDYYNKIGNEYMAYYTPQLQQQSEKAREQMMFNASRSGTQNSSAYAKNLASLDQQMGLRRNEMQTQSNDRMNLARADIARQKSNQVAALNASQGELAAGNPFLTGQIAVSGPTLAPYSALGDLFGGVTGVASNYAAASNAQKDRDMMKAYFDKGVGRQSGYQQ
jgi:hypothetical protein